jgi:hypothetical protein
MTTTLSHVRDRWGGVEEYLVENGVDRGDIGRFRSRITA